MLLGLLTQLIEDYRSMIYDSVVRVLDQQILPKNRSKSSSNKMCSGMETCWKQGKQIKMMINTFCPFRMLVAASNWLNSGICWFTRIRVGFWGWNWVWRIERKGSVRIERMKTLMEFVFLQMSLLMFVYWFEDVLKDNALGFGDSLR